MKKLRIGNAERSRNARRAGLLLLAAVLAAALSLAGPSLAAKKKSVLEGPDAYVIELEKDPKVPGAKVAYLEGHTNAEGINLKLKDLWITQPVRIVLLAKTLQDDLIIQFRKYHWKKPSQQGTTKPKGYCAFLFKTQGDVDMKITSPHGKRPFRLEVWVGPEVKPDLKPVVVHKKKN